MNKVQNLTMADVSQKDVTVRTAIARGVIRMGAQAFALLREKKLPKGDALAVAEVAAIMAAKNTPGILPLCHPIEISSVRVAFELNESSCEVLARCTVTSVARTGVEMEALVGASAALLSIYDLVKPVDPALVLESVFLERKIGGKSGDWHHPKMALDENSVVTAKPLCLGGLSIGVLTISDSSASGKSEDVSGPLLASLVKNEGAQVVAHLCVADNIEFIRDAVRQLVDGSGADIVVTTGGTGLGPRDVTPEALSGVCDRILPGVGELLRSSGARHTPMSWGSRSMAGRYGDSLVVALPGKPAAVEQGMLELIPILSHLVSMLRGGGHADGRKSKQEK